MTSAVPTVLKFLAAILIALAILGVAFTVVKNLTKVAVNASENAIQSGLGISVDLGVDKTAAQDNSGLDSLGGGLGDLSGFNFN